VPQEQACSSYSGEHEAIAVPLDISVQHLLQQIFIRKTEIPPLSPHNDVIEQIISE
jgi:hypothetical protein